MSKKLFIINAASGWGANAFRIGVELILVPYTLHRLGVEGFGICQIARSALVFFMLLQLGMAPTLVRFFATAFSNEDRATVSIVSSTALAMLVTLAIIGVLIGMACIPWFLDFYRVPEALRSDTAWLIVCIAGSFFMNMIVIVPQGLLFGANRYTYAAGVDAAFDIMRLIVVVAGFELIGPSLPIFGVSVLLASFLRFLLMWAGTRKIGASPLLKRHDIRSDTLRSISRFSLLNLINWGAASLVFQGPVLVIGKILGQEAVAVFAPALMVSQAIQGFLGQTARPLTTLASRERKRHDGGDLGKLSVDTGVLCACVAMAAVIPLWAFGPELMSFWLGGQMAYIWYMVAVMGGGVSVAQIQAANYFLALGGGSIAPTVVSHVVIAVVVILGTILGTLYAGWQIPQVVWFIAGCIFLRSALWLAWAYARQFGYHFGTYLVQVYVRPTIVAVLSILAGIGLKLNWAVPVSVVITVGIPIVLLLYAVLFAMIALPREIKYKIYDKLSHRFPWMRFYLRLCMALPDRERRGI